MRHCSSLVHSWGCTQTGTKRKHKKKQNFKIYTRVHTDLLGVDSLEKKTRNARVSQYWSNTPRVSPAPRRQCYLTVTKTAAATRGNACSFTQPFNVCVTTLEPFRSQKVPLGVWVGNEGSKLHLVFCSEREQHSSLPLPEIEMADWSTLHADDESGVHVSGRGANCIANSLQIIWCAVNFIALSRQKFAISSLWNISCFITICFVQCKWIRSQFSSGRPDLILFCTTQMQEFWNRRGKLSVPSFVQFCLLRLVLFAKLKNENLDQNS